MLQEVQKRIPASWSVKSSEEDGKENKWLQKTKPKQCEESGLQKGKNRMPVGAQSSSDGG